jgi:hypothetical protein
MTPRLMLSMFFVAAVTAPAAAQPAQGPVRDQSVSAGAQWALPHPGGGAPPGLQLTWRRWISPRFGIGTDFRWWGRSTTTEITSREQIRQDGIVIPSMQGRDDQRISSSGFGAGILAKGSIGRLSLVGGAGPGFFVDRRTHERRLDGLHDGGRETICSLGVQMLAEIEARATSRLSVFAGLRMEIRDLRASDSSSAYPTAGARFAF